MYPNVFTAIENQVEEIMNLIRSSISIAKNQKCNCRQVYSTCERCIHGTQKLLSSEEKSDKDKDSNSVDDMSEPTNCCMSGCANCVWIEYAEKLSATLKNSDADVQKMILDKVQDPNMRAFLSMELRFRKIIKD